MKFQLRIVRTAEEFVIPADAWDAMHDKPPAYVMVQGYKAKVISFEGIHLTVELPKGAILGAVNELIDMPKKRTRARGQQFGKAEDFAEPKDAEEVLGKTNSTD